MLIRAYFLWFASAFQKGRRGHFFTTLFGVFLTPKELELFDLGKWLSGARIQKSLP
jgi:hypothetical protein